MLDNPVVILLAILKARSFSRKNRILRLILFFKTLIVNFRDKSTHMKTLLTFISSILTIISFGQQTINGTLTHGGIQRSYILYVPASYSSTNSAPLVFNFHGYTSNSIQQIFYGDFRPIADTAGFLLVVPQGTTDAQGNTYWNAGWNGAADDVGFTEALLDDLALSYNINQDKVYSTGMSNGGFMSYYLACNLSDRIAAIASVTGAMTRGTTHTCNPQHPTPVLAIHGDADNTVAYTGGFISESVQDGLDYWVSYNNNNSTPSFAAVPNINTSDNSSVEHYIYTNGDSCVDVEHYKVLNGGHTWPGASVDIGNGATNQDINASSLIWEFFSKYDINGKIDCGLTGVEENKINKKGIEIFPNPANTFFTIKGADKEVSSVRIIDFLGKEIRNIKLNGAEKSVIPINGINKGIYFIELLNEGLVQSTSKLIVN